MTLLVKGDSHLGSLKPRGSEGVDGVHLLPGDVALPARLVCLGAPKDHEAVISLRKLTVFL
jgi:hypothetical protein